MFLVLDRVEARSCKMDETDLVESAARVNREAQFGIVRV
jgi:hypothetical protein